MLTIRYRSVLWFAAGVAITVALVWSLLAWRVFAAPGPGESTVVSVTPTRILDTRDPIDLGLAGPFVSAVSQKLQVTGPTVPAGSTGVLLNVTVVGPTAAGFLSIRPGDASGAPSTSSLNFASGVNLPNAVQVALPVSGANAGQIDITYDAYGNAGPTTDVLIDVVGYTTNAGIQSLVADLALKANTADVNASLATKASAADVTAIKALPAMNILASGTVTNSGTKATDAVELGDYTVSKTGTGVYILKLPMPCSGDFPVVMLTLGYLMNDGEIALGTGSCFSGQVSWTVNTSDSAGAPSDKYWQFLAIGARSLGPADEAIADEPVADCVRVATGDGSCD